MKRAREKEKSPQPKERPQKEQQPTIGVDIRRESTSCTRLVPNPTAADFSILQRLIRWLNPVVAAMLAVAIVALCLCSPSPAAGNSAGQTSQSNFVAYHTDRDFAQQVVDAAETYRRDLSASWLGHFLPTWRSPCPIYPTITSGGGGGHTSFVFDSGEVGQWEMRIQGTREEILRSVLPHEILHTIFASHFRRPLPRWADEGAASSVEAASERTRLNRSLVEFLRTGRGIPFNSLFGITEYPQDVLPLYAQGHSLATFLIEHDSQNGRPIFVNFLAAGLRDLSGWKNTLADFYGYRSLGELQNAWLDWLKAGSVKSSQSATRVVSYQAPSPCGPGGCQFQWQPGQGWIINRLRTRTQGVKETIKGAIKAVAPGTAHPNRPKQPSRPPNTVSSPSPSQIIAGSQQPEQWQAVTINVADGQAQIETGASSNEGPAENPATGSGNPPAVPVAGPAAPAGPRGPRGVPGPQGPSGPPGQDVDQSQIAALQQTINDLKIQLANLQNKKPVAPAAPVLTVNLVDDDGNIIDSQQIRVGVDPLNLDLHPVKVQAPLAQVNGGQ